MRLVVAIGLLALSVTAAAQQSSSPWVYLSQGTSRGTVAVQDELYDGAPSASIPARPSAQGVQVTAKAFRIRAWQEAGKSRVAVFAITEVPDSGGKLLERETLLGTYLLDAGETANVSGTEKYGAAPVTLGVSR